MYRGGECRSQRRWGEFDSRLVHSFEGLHAVGGELGWQSGCGEFDSRQVHSLEGVHVRGQATGLCKLGEVGSTPTTSIFLLDGPAGSKRRFHTAQQRGSSPRSSTLFSQKLHTERR